MTGPAGDIRRNIITGNVTPRPARITWMIGCDHPECTRTVSGTGRRAAVAEAACVTAAIGEHWGSILTPAGSRIYYCPDHFPIHP